MIKYIIKRLLMGILVLFGTSLLIFTIARVVPGDVATIALGARATEAAKEALRMEMNLYDPFPVQYVKWLTSAVTGNFGNSFVTKRPVAMDVAQFLPATLELIIMAGVFMVIGTFILGLLAGKYKNTWVDGLIRVLSYIGVALPAFVIGILLLLLFGYKLQAIPVLGRLSTTLVAPKTVTGFFVLDALLAGDFTVAWDAFYICFFRHLHLPYRRWFRMPESFALLWLITQPKNIWQFLRDMDFLRTC